MTKNIFYRARTPNKGFTLIELVIVLVLLGVLAVLAATKFIDLSGDAKAAVMKGVAGSMRSGMALVHSQAVIQNQLGPTGVVQITEGYDPILVEYGYPTMKYQNLQTQLSSLNQWMDMEIADASKVKKKPDDYDNNTLALAKTNKLIGSPNEQGIQIFFTDAIKQGKTWRFECVIQYSNATATETAKVTSYLDEC